MSFQLYEPKGLVFHPSLKEGEVSLDRVGTATFRAEELKSIGIADRAVVLVDESNLRIGLRAPREGESDKSLRVLTPGRKNKPDHARRRISLNGAIRRVRLEPAAVRGRYDLLIRGNGKEGMLILNLAGIEQKGS